MITALCPNCVWLFVGNVGKPACTAYPDGIPERILTGAADHATVQDDQTGEWVFEPVDPDRVSRE